MLIDETAGSGGDLLPWMFRKFKLGPLVGKRTWGGLVGILGFPTLMDGGTVTAPNLAIWSPRTAGSSRTRACRPTSRWSSRRRTSIAGHDPQLEKAIALILQELKKHPPHQVKHPAFPNKTPRTK